MLPPASLLDRDIIEQKAIIVQAIEAHLIGMVSIEALSAWALKAFHSLNSDDQDIIEQTAAADSDSEDDEPDAFWSRAIFNESLVSFKGASFRLPTR